MITTIKRLGFTETTEIKGKSIPAIMQGKDVIGESATGSGKTLAFGAGIVNKVIPRHGLQSLILTPTRELAEQIRKALLRFAKYKPLSIISIYGGVSINPQIDNLPYTEVVVGTPGRILAHIERNTMYLGKVNILGRKRTERMH